MQTSTYFMPQRCDKNVIYSRQFLDIFWKRHRRRRRRRLQYLLITVRLKSNLWVILARDLLTTFLHWFLQKFFARRICPHASKLFTKKYFFMSLAIFCGLHLPINQWNYDQNGQSLKRSPNLYIFMEKLPTYQCDQNWQNFATLAKP